MKEQCGHAGPCLLSDLTSHEGGIAADGEGGDEGERGHDALRAGQGEGATAVRCNDTYIQRGNVIAWGSMTRTACQAEIRK